MVQEAEEEFGGEGFDQFLSSIKEIEKHARERRVLKPDYSKSDLISDIKREIPDVDEKLINKMADFVFGHLGESTQVVEAQSAEELEVGEPVKITGNVQFQGKTGTIDSFGTGKRFVIVDLGQDGLRSFHSSDVSYCAEEEPDELESVEEDSTVNPQDTITMDVPLFIRTLEFAREDAKDDMDLHDAAENALKLSANGDTLTMDNYSAIVPSDAVEEAGPGFIDVSGWSSEQVRRLGHEDDDYEEPRRNYGYGYNRPAAKPVLKGYYFYNVGPADEHDATAIGLKKTKSGKWALAVYNTSGHSTTVKKQSADRAFGQGRWWAPKTESVDEAQEDALMSNLKGLKSWQVVIMNNYYRGKYSDYSGRYFYVLATSAEEAEKVVLDNASAILQDLLAMKAHNGKKILPRSSAVRITPDRIGKIEDGTVAGRMSTTSYKKMYSPQGVMMVKLTNGAIADVQGQEQDVAEGYDSEELANEVYAEFERMYPNLARYANERTVHAAILDVLNYGGDNDASALAQDVARAVKRDRGGLVEAGGAKQYNAFKREWRAKHGADAKVPAYDSKEYTAYCWREGNKKKGVAEEQVNEISTKLRDKYVQRATDDYGHANFAARASKSHPGLEDYSKEQDARAKKRAAGLNRALSDKRTGRVTESNDDNPVVQAVTRRILLQRTDLLSKYGPAAITAAIDDLADYVGDVDEIGSSDVSAWVKHIEQLLANGAGQEINEISDQGLQNYRRHAHYAIQGYKFGSKKDASNAAEIIAKREKGMDRAGDKIIARKKAEDDRRMAMLIAKLPELKAEYARMKAEYKSLGGSDWQYADRDQNLTDAERRARDMEGAMNNLWRQISAAERAQGSK